MWNSIILNSFACNGKNYYISFIIHNNNIFILQFFKQQEDIFLHNKFVVTLWSDYSVSFFFYMFKRLFSFSLEALIFLYSIKVQQNTSHLFKTSSLECLLVYACSANAGIFCTWEQNKNYQWLNKSCYYVDWSHLHIIWVGSNSGNNSLS